MTDEENPVPPKDLTPETARWWSDVVATYQLQPHHVRLLTLAARTWDRGETARQALRKHGMTYTDKHGVKRPAPEATIEKNCAISFARLLRELRLDSAPDDDDARPPRNAGTIALRLWYLRKQKKGETP
jgi:phage terminase small subunit